MIIYYYMIYIYINTLAATQIRFCAFTVLKIKPSTLKKFLQSWFPGCADSIGRTRTEVRDWRIYIARTGLGARVGYVMVVNGRGRSVQAPKAGLLVRQTVRTTDDISRTSFFECRDNEISLMSHCLNEKVSEIIIVHYNCSVSMGQKGKIFKKIET